MPVPGTVWAADTWTADAWAADTWADAVDAVVMGDARFRWAYQLTDAIGLVVLWLSGITR